MTNTVIQSFGRLRPGVTLPQLRGELESAMQRVIAEAPKTHAGWTTRVMSLREAQFGQQRPALWMLLIAVVMLALLACANLSNLTLAQVIGRRPDLALRSAIGGSATDLIRLQLIETLLLSVIGIAAGLLIGGWMLPRSCPSIRYRERLSVSVSTGASRHDRHNGRGRIAGIRPAAVDASVAGEPHRRYCNASRRAIGSRSDYRVRRLLVAMQTAMAVVLTICGALLLTGLNRASRIEPGFDPSNVLGAQMRLSAAAYPTEAARTAFIGQVLDQIRAVPGVAAAGATLNPFISAIFLPDRGADRRKTDSRWTASQRAVPPYQP